MKEMRNVVPPAFFWTFLFKGIHPIDEHGSRRQIDPSPYHPLFSFLVFQIPREYEPKHCTDGDVD